MNSFRLLTVDTISTRIAEILENMEGPERGKQTRLAETAGCTKALIGQLLKNPSQQLGYEYAKNIEKALGYRVDWILNGQLPKRMVEKQEDERDDPRVAGSVDGDELIELILLYRQATDASRERILSYARSADKVPGALRRVFPVNNA